MKKVRVRLGKRSYAIIIGRGILRKAGLFLEKMAIGRDAVIITNSRIWSLYGKVLKHTLDKHGLSSRCVRIPDRESSKSNKEVLRLVRYLSRHDKQRGTFIIAFGGGVVGDLAGFVASIYKRGIPYIQIPTTLLGQVDSAIGGKVAIDLDIAKNLVGSFYQPKLVISDISLLKSLPPREIRSGLAEIIKYGIIADRNLFAFLEQNLDEILRLNEELMEYLVARCSQIKARIVEKDETDTKGIRAILNLGHTIGHAIETAARYSKLYTHGEAVAIGMIVASEIAFRLGVLKEKDMYRIAGLVKIARFPTLIRKLRLKDIIDAHLYDKKIIHGMNRFVLPVRIGKVMLCENVSKKLISQVIKNRYEDTHESKNF